MVAVIAGGVLIMRGGDVDQFLRFLGIRRESVSAEENVQTYVQRTLLAYIGWRIFLDHPVAGAGWQASVKEEQVYGDYLADAKRGSPTRRRSRSRLPSTRTASRTPTSRRSPTSAWSASRLLLATFAPASSSPAGGASRPARLDAAQARRGRVAPARDGPWTAVGLVAGIPLDALTWLALGLAATAASGAALARD